MPNRISPTAKVYNCCSIVDSALGENVVVGDYSQLARCCLSDGVRLQRFQTLLDVDLGKHSYTGRYFTAWECSIGAFCSISWNVSIGGANHDYTRLTTHAMLYNDDFGFLEGADPCYNRFTDTCVVGNDVWIGCGAIVNRGVKIGDGAVIGSGAVVTKDVEPYCIVAGNPAKVLKRRFEESIVLRLLDLRWWDLPDPVLKENIELLGAAPSDSNLQKLEKICRSEKE